MVTSFCHLFGLFLPIFGHFNVILYIFGIFLEISAILGQVIWCWYYWPHLDHFPKHFRPFLAILGSFCPFLVIFRQFSTILGQVIWCWYYWPHLDHFAKHFRPLWAIFGSFFLNFCHFRSGNLVLVLLASFGPFS